MSLSFVFPCFGKPPPKMHYVNSVKFREKTQSSSFRLLLFPNTCWVTRTDIVFSCRRPLFSNTFCGRCMLLIVLIFAKGPSHPVFVGHCFQTILGPENRYCFLFSKLCISMLWKPISEDACCYCNFAVVVCRNWASEFVSYINLLIRT